jgi:phosphomannomutase
VKDYFKALKVKRQASRQWKFIIDCSNGFDADIIQYLSKALDIQGVPIFCRQDGFTQKDPEPTIDNARFLGTIVRETRSDGGFFLKSGASRILVVKAEDYWFHVRPSNTEPALRIMAEGHEGEIDRVVKKLINKIKRLAKTPAGKVK